MITLTKELVYTPMVRVYKNMLLSILTTFATIFFVGTHFPSFTFLYNGAMLWVTILLPLPAIFAVSSILQNCKSDALNYAAFLGFAVLMGLSLAPVVIMSPLELVGIAFGSAALLFTIMAIYGAYTKRDLSSWGSFLMVGLIALIIASFINIFVLNSMLNLIISGITIIVFLGLTAYDVQSIQEMIRYEQNTGLELMGALLLYMNFINLFLSILRILSETND